MIKNELKISKTDLPHIPYHIIDDKENVIATIFHNLESDLYSRLFKNAPRMHQILWDVLENYSQSISDDRLSEKDLKILNDISELQVELLDSEIRTPTTWQDEVYEKHKDEPLAKVFKDKK